MMGQARHIRCQISVPEPLKGRDPIIRLACDAGRGPPRRAPAPRSCPDRSLRRRRLCSRTRRTSCSWSASARRRPARSASSPLGPDCPHPRQLLTGLSLQNVTYSSAPARAPVGRGAARQRSAARARGALGDARQGREGRKLGLERFSFVGRHAEDEVAGVSGRALELVAARPELVAAPAARRRARREALDSDRVVQRREDPIARFALQRPLSLVPTKIFEPSGERAKPRSSPVNTTSCAAST